MRVLAITNDWPTSRFPGLGAHNRQLFAGLERIGMEVRILFFDRKSKGRRIYLGVAQRVRAELRRTKFDVVHITYGGVMASRATSVVDKLPMVVSFCGSDLLGSGGKGPWRRLLANYGVRASQRAAARATTIILKARSLEHALPKRVDKSKIIVVPNGVDLRRFTPLDRRDCCQRLGWDTTKFHILFPKNSGNAVKRLGLAKAAVHRLRGLGVAAELRMLQGVAHRDVPLWINASDVLLLTSSHEGSPNVVKEALACNRPVVSVNVGDVAERIVNVEGCYLAQPDSSELADKLRRVHDEPRGIEGRKAVEGLSLTTVSTRIRACYQHALARFSELDRKSQGT